MNLKYLLLLFPIFFNINNLYSQNSKTKQKLHNIKQSSSIDTTVYLGNKLDKQAHYKGGESLLLKFVLDNLKNIENVHTSISIQIGFIVEKNGSRAYYSLPNKKNYLEEDRWLVDTAFSMILKMPLFEPALIKGKKVRSSNYIDIVICFNKNIFVQHKSTLPQQEGLKDGGYFNPCPDDPNEIVTFAEQMPEFIGGKDSMEQFIKRNLIYPVNAKENGVEGKVQIEFVVWSDGKISRVKALSHKGWGLEEEAVRVVKMMPKWKPGKQNGKPVNVKFHYPIIFKP